LVRCLTQRITFLKTPHETSLYSVGHTIGGVVPAILTCQEEVDP